MMSKSNIKVSILVPIYGVEKYIAECAKSLFEQSYQNIEYVFVNDCTQDNSIGELKKQLENFPHRKDQVSIIVHEKNKGLSAARNTALLNSTGEYVLPMDSDDFLCNKDAIKELVEAVESENADAVFYDAQFYPNIRNFPNYDFSLNPQELTKDIIKRNGPIRIWDCLYKRSLFIDNNIYSIEGITMGEDYAIKPLLTYNMKKIVHIKKNFYSYRLNNTSSITSNIKPKHIEDLKKCIDGFKSFFERIEDGNEYMRSIEIGAIKCKIELIKIWAFQNCSDEIYKKIIELFPNYTCRLHELSPSDYILYQLIKIKLKRTIKFIADIKRK